MTPNAVVIATETCRYEIGADGRNRAFVNLAEGKDYAEPGQPVMVVCQKGKVVAATSADLAGDTLRVGFGDTGVQARVTLAIRPRYFTLTVADVSGADVEWLQFCNLPLDITQSVGPLVNAAWNDRLAVGVLACNDRTHSYGAAEARAVLQAKCYREYGFAGAKVAVMAVPTAAPDPGSRLLDVIEAVELEQGLPHLTLNGVWIKRAPERFASRGRDVGIGVQLRGFDLHAHVGVEDLAGMVCQEAIQQ